MRQLETDILVIGGGTAGLSAALMAIEKGANKVIVLEKRINIGGNSSMAGGFLFGAESRLQKKEGKIVSRDAVFQEALEYSHYDRINPRLIRALINRSGETIDWLEDHGMEFELTMNNAHLIKGKFSAAIMQYSLAMEILAERIKQGGGQILLRTAARKILRGKDGAIAGVMATTRDGEDIHIKARSVILAPGGFTGNKELLRKYFGYDNFATEALPLKGDGIQMADEAGAYLEDYATWCQHGIHPCLFSLETVKNQPNPHVLTGPCSVWVNAKGERFYDTGTQGRPLAMGKLFLRQPGKVAYVLLDDKLLQSPIEKLMGEVRMGGEASQDILKMRKLLQKEAERGVNVRMSDSWDDIATYIGAEPRVLKATIDEYNSFCDRGYDETFAKDKRFLLPLRTPPYYAVKLQAGMVEAIGPVRINERTEVLDKQEEVIPGFYAAGAITSGWCGHDYHLFGSNLGFGTTAGRIAGENAAQFVLNKQV